MTVYDSDVHLSKWRQRAVWILLRRRLWMPPAFVLCALPVFLLGVWWPVLVVVAGVAFACGWNAARRRWLSGEPIDPL